MFAQISGLTLNFALESSAVGDGVPLVFIDSLGTDLRIWDAVVPQLADRYAILRYDIRGHGLSDVPSGPCSIHDHAGDLAGLLDHLRIQRAIVIGISVGGMIALDFAANHADRVRALVLCDTGMTIGTAAMWNDRIAKVHEEGMAGIAEAVIVRWFTPEFTAQQPAATNGYRNMLTRTPARGYIATCEAIRDADLTEAARGIQAKALVLCGAQDIATSPGLTRTLAETMPNARHELIDNAAHLPCIEQPKAIAARIASFLEQVHATTDDGRSTSTPVQPSSEDRYERGMIVRRAVLGDAHVDRAEANRTEFDADFQRFITEMAWGSVWARSGLGRETRHLITIALLAALGKEHELAMHIHATKNTGVTPDEVKEALLQVAVYAGVPAANAAFALAKKIYAED
jgi:3-oxoadipate enol-lactonase/4-carboxymuconolactone decarboxylase